MRREEYARRPESLLRQYGSSVCFLLALDWDDIDEGKKTLKVSKNIVRVDEKTLFNPPRRWSPASGRFQIIFDLGLIHVCEKSYFPLRDTGASTPPHRLTRYQGARHWSKRSKAMKAVQQATRPIVDVFVESIKKDFSKYKLAKSFLSWAKKHGFNDLQPNEQAYCKSLTSKINRSLK